MNNFNYVLAILVILISGLVYAANEKTFSDTGYLDFVVEGKNVEQCQEYSFVNSAEPLQYSVLSLKTEFFPIVSGNATIKVYLNDLNVEAFNLTPKNFSCANQCTTRLFLNQADILP